MRRFRIFVIEVYVTVLNRSTDCFWRCGGRRGDAVGHLDSGIDAEGATEGVPRSNFRYRGLGDVFVVQERGENAREEGVVAVVRD
jgi:hypothetical protein